MKSSGRIAMDKNYATMMKVYIVFAIGLMVAECRSFNVTETEMFSISITPQMFNWTDYELNNQYKFHASIVNKPDLPNWLHYIYSARHHCGFIYGTPPQDQDDTVLQIIALNKENYETRDITIHLHVLKKIRVAKFKVQLKIDNLNVEDLLDEYRMESLKDIFRKKLWRESADDLYTVFMVSAIELGARLPLKPTEGEGVVLKLGSYKPHSSDLLKLQEEVRPLFKLTLCPRDFKRTTVERLFRDVGFNLDWCSFRLIENSNEILPTTDINLNSNKILDEANKYKINMDQSFLMNDDNHWLPPAKHEIPRRSYVQEFMFTIIVPMFVMIVLVSVLSMILCFQHEGIPDVESDYFFDSIFHICGEYIEEKRTARNQVSDSKADLSRYHNEATSATESNPNNDDSNGHNIGDNFSNKSTLGVSPNSSLSKNPSPRSNPNLIIDYNRPQPPPYLGSNTNTLVLRQRPNLDEELAAKRDQARALEESLQLLNEANIINTNYHMKDQLFAERIRLNDDLFDDNVDSNLLEDDYIQMKPDSGLSLRRHIGMLNGSVNDDDILKNVDNF